MSALNSIISMEGGIIKTRVPHISTIPCMVLTWETIAFSKVLGVKRVYLIHMTHEIGLHNEAGRLLPHGVEFGYDGETITV